MNYKFKLKVDNDETDERIIFVEALSLESLQEQLHKVERAIEAYEETQEDYGKDSEG